MASSDDNQGALPVPAIETDLAQAQWVKANLAALDALLNLENDDASFRALFRALNVLFAFERALVLDDAGDGLRCIAAEPATLVGQHWPDKSLQGALDVRAFPAGGLRDVHGDQQLLSELAASDEPALCLPIALSEPPRMLVLLRAKGAADFGAGQVAAARQCAAVALAALATRKAAQERRLFKEIIDHLPISLTVQDDNGRFILVNAMAAANLATPAEVLIGASPPDFLPKPEAESRREWEQTIIRQGKTIAVEEALCNQHGERTWLTSHKPVRIFLIARY